MFPCGAMAASTYIRSPPGAADTKLPHARGHWARDGQSHSSKRRVAAMLWHGPPTPHPTRLIRPRGSCSVGASSAPRSARLHHRAVRDHALRRIPPKCHEQFAGEGHDGDPPGTAMLGADAIAEPAAQGRPRLVAQPHPRELYGGRAQARVARLRDPLLAVDPAALPRAGRPAGEGRELALVIEAAGKRLEPEHAGGIGSADFAPGAGLGVGR